MATAASRPEVTPARRGGREDVRPETAPQWLVSASEVAWRSIVVVGGLALALVVLARLRLVVIPLALALLLAGVLTPPADALRARGVPALAATWLVAVTSIAVLALVIWFAAASVAGEVRQVDELVVRGWRSAMEWLRTTAVGAILGEGDPLRAFAQESGRNRAQVVRWLVSGATTVVDVGIMIVLTLFFTFFFIKDGAQLCAAVARQLDRERANRAEEAGAAVWHVLSHYLRGMAVIALVDALLFGVALALIGVPLVLVIMVITFLGAFVPFLGPVVATVVGALVALAEGGVRDAGLVVAAGIVIQQFEGNVVEPIVMGRFMRLHPVVVLAAVTGGAVLGGLPGAFFAVPVVAAGTALYGRFHDGPVDDHAVSAPGASGNATVGDHDG